MTQPIPSGLREWQRCTTIADACELTAQWIEGRIEYSPTSAGHPEDETTELTATLARINRSGFLTIDSQPARPLSGGDGQRAYLVGRCPEEVAARIVENLGPSELVVMWAEPHASSDIMTVATFDDGKAFTFLGRSRGSDDRYIFSEHANPAIGNVIGELWQVQIFDPVWGRDDMLWSSLVQLLEIQSKDDESS